MRAEGPLLIPSTLYPDPPHAGKCPADFSALAAACMDLEASARPTFADIMLALRAMGAAVKRGTLKYGEQPQQAGAAPGTPGTPGAPPSPRAAAPAALHAAPPVALPAAPPAALPGAGGQQANPLLGAHADAAL